MNYFKKPVVAILLTVLIVLSSTAISINTKLSNKSEDIIDGFYYGSRLNGQLMKSVYYNLNDLCTLSGEIIIVADNYGIDTRALSASLENLSGEIGYHNSDIDSIYDAYEAFYNELFSILLELSTTELSLRHIEFMASASEQISGIKLSIENSGYNESVRNFYKKYDKFPVKFFAEFFDIDYPDYFS